MPKQSYLNQLPPSAKRTSTITSQQLESKHPITHESAFFNYRCDENNCMMLKRLKNDDQVIDKLSLVLAFENSN